VQQFDLAVLILRVVFGVFLAVHGYNKFFGKGGLTGTTEIGAGLFLAAGLLTPLAGGAMVALMLVAIWVAHRKVGFFVFRPGQGWEYCASIAVVSFCVATMGAGRWSLDHASGIHFHGWSGALTAGLLGIGGAVAHLAISYRPTPS